MTPPIPEFLIPVPLDKNYRLLTHGPSVLVPPGHIGATNVMAAAWSMPLDFDPIQSHGRRPDFVIVTMNSVRSGTPNSPRYTYTATLMHAVHDPRW